MQWSLTREMWIQEDFFAHGGVHLKKYMIAQCAEETFPPTFATSNGHIGVILSHYNQYITIINLKNESIIVDVDDGLTFEQALDKELVLGRTLKAITTSLYDIKFKETWFITILTWNKVLALRVVWGGPHVCTYPKAIVAWLGFLTLEIKLNVQFRSFLYRPNGQTIQIKFESTTKEGFVLVQPYVERIRHLRQATFM